MKLTYLTTALLLLAAPSFAYEENLGSCWQNGKYVGSIYDCHIVNGLSHENAIQAVRDHYAALAKRIEEDRDNKNSNSSGSKGSTKEITSTQPKVVSTKESNTSTQNKSTTPTSEPSNDNSSNPVPQQSAGMKAILGLSELLDTNPTADEVHNYLTNLPNDITSTVEEKYGHTPEYKESMDKMNKWIDNRVVN